MRIRRAYDRVAAEIDEAPIVARVLGAIGMLALLVATAFAIVLARSDKLCSECKRLPGDGARYRRPHVRGKGA